MVKRQVCQAKVERQDCKKFKHLGPRAHEKNCACGTWWMRAVRCTVTKESLLHEEVHHVEWQLRDRCPYSCQSCCPCHSCGSCGSCPSCGRYHVDEEEEEDCGQLTFQRQLFHWRSHLSLSSIGRRRSPLRGAKKMVCLPSLLSLPPAMSPVSRIELMLKGQPRNTNSCQLYGTMTRPINSGAIKNPPAYPWIARKYTKDFVGILTVLEPRLVCSLQKCVQANHSPKNVVSFVQMLQSILESSYSGELLRQFLALLDHSGTPISWPISRSLLKEISLCMMERQEYCSTCFPAWVLFLSSNTLDQKESWWVSREFSLCWIVPILYNNVHLLFASACSESNSELVRLCPGSEKWNSFTNRFFPRHIATQDIRSGLFRDGIWISSPWLVRSCATWTSMTVQSLFSLEFLHTPWIKEFTSCEVTLLSISLFTEFSFGNFSEVGSLSFGLGQNSSHQFEAQS